ncbi:MULTISPECIES: FadR/GntR family transcriptional regulator [unclassified Neptuniibacter]|jgi:DNA-binding FadR family transcriptional regulator|uniref:FadR/GntR family transcriptional regulator n=1 Tax=unclassified Neptuniibacter TaxID=2630693 RepID=UPI0026E16DD7|nr:MULTISPECIES: FadR/GntR family transcriptional regulator [unclassified Neptuniibacter]MDO6514273.1 FadR/GntR family transcriptional regulator [Neptuniibacter sp. 2_MG-2023]MDO6592598.1 FadR/GntR family transcriptional regulator [Neptuniibacter sp. 1_MG-2023]
MSIKKAGSDVKGLSQQLSLKLQQDILYGDVCPGHKLTSQRELASTYQVSRSTVREAIQDLELKGMVKTYPGGGSVCLNLLEPHLDMPLGGLGHSLEFQLQVMEMRAALEGEAAFYAALRATDEQLEKIEQEYQIVHARSSGVTTLAKAKADLRFHMMIAEASHNVLVMSFSQIFYDRYFNAIYGVLDLTLKKFGRYPDRIGAQHTQIYQALMNRDAPLAKKIATEHINYTRSQLEGAG